MASASLDSLALSAQEPERSALHRHRYGIAFECGDWSTCRLADRDGARPNRIRAGLTAPGARVSPLRGSPTSPRTGRVFLAGSPHRAATGRTSSCDGGVIERKSPKR
jgi:hypothetical protein